MIAKNCEFKNMIIIIIIIIIFLILLRLLFLTSKIALVIIENDAR